MNRSIALLAVLGLFAFTSTSADAAHQTAPVSQGTVSSLLNAPIAPIAAAATHDMLAGGCRNGGGYGYGQGYYRPSYNVGYRGGYGHNVYRGGGGYGGGYYGRPALGYGGYGGGYGRGYNRGGFGLYIGF